MFKFLKRLLSPEPAPLPAARRKSRSSKPTTSGPAALPEVIEGNEDTDWALWENSKTELDSQMQGLSRASGYGKLGAASQYDTLPSELGDVADSLYGDVDAFGTVRKRDR